MTFAKTGDVRPYVVAMVLSALATACGSSGLPAAPSPSLTPEGYAGRWSGTTSMGTAIDFTVAANGSVTAIAVGYNGDGCSGMNTYAEVDVEIRNPYSSLGRPQFQYSSGSPDSVALTVVFGRFDSDTVANGSVGFRGYLSCGTSVFGGTWTASKRG
jgi:hypothetical protein